MSSNPGQAKAESREAYIPNVEALCRQLHIQHWDLLIVGDGSGSGWDEPCGWSSFLIDKNYNARRYFVGGMNAGSINLAETMPYLQSLAWYDQWYGRDLLQNRGRLRVHVVTDSTMVANAANSKIAPENQPPAVLPLCSMLVSLRRRGYIFQFHWAKRMTTQLNWAADLAAGLARLGTKKIVTHIDNSKEVTSNVDSISNATAKLITQLTLYDAATGKPLDIYNITPGS